MSLQWYYCPECDRHFPGIESYKGHLQDHNDDDNPPRPSAAEVEQATLGGVA